MRALLGSSPLFVFAVVAALGSLLGSVRVLGVRVGVAAVLFVGLGLSGLVPEARLPEELQHLGLVLFVYAIGIASAPGLRAALRGRGPVGMAVVVLTVALAGAAALALGRGLGLSMPHIAGVFAGALTNTPALAETVQALRAAGAPADMLAAPVVAYSVAYPAGVAGSLAGVLAALRLGPPPPAADAPRRDVDEATVRVAAGPALGRTLGEVRVTLGPCTFARHRRGDAVCIAADDIVLQEGDLLTVVGAPAAVQAAVDALGQRDPRHLDDDRSVLDFRRILVSQREVIGVPLRTLALLQNHGGRITRVRRGDVDFVPTDDTRLEPGDRVRVVAPRNRMAALTRLFGDSMRAVSEVDMLPFGLGVAMGIALGHVTVPLPGGLTFRLGVAGGPLVVGMLLGNLVRTGPLVWTLPGSANLTLRHFGLILFFAGVGTRSGPELFRVLPTQTGLLLAAVAAGLAALTAALAVSLGRALTPARGPALAGMVAAVHTQPAALAFAEEQHESGDVSLAYAAAFPIATVAKLLTVQVLLRLFG